ncbi:PREDICTED: uncharacterized protein LOC109583286 [Amphimedon queenslandica]|uniref:Uncharacterized protein n=1 Tax=Amphimedon queenslandica TaxID=400682 RepID=A0A1X7UH17_AMPQE|nr:PREDICTED: uncharacterized protein LOC109583286 [Amphimedon queenslandica]|eukprot:XP_019854116.1 PREDICTED: uncharacterized protein LOC109583286 [Amphimedon queenslandica]
MKSWQPLLPALVLSFIVLVITFLYLYDFNETVLLLPYHKNNSLAIRKLRTRATSDSQPTPTVITALASNHYSESLDMIGTVHYYLPNSDLLIYDLGLKYHQVKVLQKLRNTYVIPYNYSRYQQYSQARRYYRCYSWKIHVINEVLSFSSHSQQLFLWLDASIRIVKPVDPCIKKLKSFPLVAGEKHIPGHNMIAFAKDSTVKYLDIKRESMRGMVGFCSGILFFNRSSPIIQLLLRKWVDCAMHQQCICGDGPSPVGCVWEDKGGWIAYNGCHRFDQVTLNILVAKYFDQYKYSITSWDCSESFHIQRRPTMNWRRYIALKNDYR